MAFGRPTAEPVVHAPLDDEAYGQARRHVFLRVAAVVLLIGAVYTLLQPTVYRSNATVLMSAPTAIDEQMLDADIQGVAIQRRTLTGAEITRSLAEQLESDYGITIEPLDLRRLLDVSPVPETNLLDLSASGGDAELLPVLVETWITVYSDLRARDIEARKTQTMTEIGDELDGLAGKLTEARGALEAYRAEHEIISMERQENAVLAELDGLNQSLNNAVEEEIRAKAYLDTLQASLAAGEQVVPENERSEVSAMAELLADLRSRLGELRARYTDDYIRKDPRLREIPDQISELEQELSAAYVRGSKAELNNAERAHAAAENGVAEIRARLEAHKQAVADFNTIYATHQALVEDLARLEELNRETQARQVQIEVRRVEKYPQVSVIDWPGPDAQRIGPDYLLLLGGTLVGALLAGIFGVWLYAYLHPRSAQPAYVTLSGVHMYPQDGEAALENLSQTTQRLEKESALKLAVDDPDIDDAGHSAGTEDNADESSEGNNGASDDSDEKRD
jgi:succinoglycan biosynthesis transport protein ExoP